MEIGRIVAVNRRLIAVACVAVLCAGIGRGADVRGYNHETGYRLSSGLRIVSITPAAKARQEFIAQPAPADAPVEFDEAKATDAELEAHFAATPDLRDRFSSAKAYVANVRHPAK